MQQNKAIQIYLTNLINLYRRKELLLIDSKKKIIFFAYISVMYRRIELNRVHFKVNKVLFELLFFSLASLRQIKKKSNEQALSTEKIQMEGAEHAFYLWPTLINIEKKKFRIICELFDGVYGLHVFGMWSL